MAFVRRQTGGVTAFWWEVPGAAGTGTPVRAWFGTRLGGVSPPPFDTLNVSYAVRDLPEAVQENRRRLLAAGGRQLQDQVGADQVHQDRVVWVGEAEQGTAVPHCDGLLTDRPGVVLAMGFADCVPIFLVHPPSGTVGLVHAGWRGTRLGIAARAVAALAAHGIDPAGLVAGIGPSIGPCCYEVGEEVYRAVAGTAGDPGVGRPVPGTVDRYRLDLWEANRRILVAAGVRPEAVDVARLCTACEARWFFSHRRDAGRTGRMGGYIWRM
ncbi:Polyphenol oxidase [Candidatus Hydrogenisulfobacillus filiaventi]|uniref:Purine nucleoside phosphorylase n=1 Tax=Candidatus Hydrogenisulfobacillus filiaventi TaxID=2707344 RepID=A0A6F8ZF31_9FIRM|nr:peptidoglycan editing factor PgeF [Bacillota bacterium]CAB1128478.1 Polyphenol oxidase [Candidatus Hydrogenisulfobacillus filiaventi]